MTDSACHSSSSSSSTLPDVLNFKSFTEFEIIDCCFKDKECKCISVPLFCVTAYRRISHYKTTEFSDELVDKKTIRYSFAFSTSLGIFRFFLNSTRFVDKKKLVNKVVNIFFLPRSRFIEFCYFRK